jgi:DNA-binding GntR family transcriptional regulator
MDENNNIHNLDKETLSDKAYKILVELIVSQKLESGVRLKEQHVAKELGISATPIREAFKKLAADGFVEIKPYYGVVVRRTDEKESDNIYQCLVALSEMEMKLAIDNFDDNFVIQLAGIIAKEKKAKSFFEFHSLNLDFHHTIWVQTGNEVFVKIMKMLVASTHMRYADGCEQGQKHIIQGHQNILEAIKIKSPKMAHKAMLELLEKSMQIIKNSNQYRKLDFLIKRVIY